MKVFWLLGLFAAVALGAAAVWLGGLNQDEGWYLYAANLVAEGKVPYADFAYTQGPVLPIVYSFFAGIWKTWGLLGARVFTLALGFAGILFAALTARRLVGVESFPRQKADGTVLLRRGETPRLRDGGSASASAAALVVFFLLGSNLYHLYYLAIPKTYALATLFVSLGFYLLTFLRDERKIVRVGAAILSGASLALAAGTRISLGAILAVVGLWLLVDAVRMRRRPPVDAVSHRVRNGENDPLLTRRDSASTVTRRDSASTVTRRDSASTRWPFLWFGLGGGVVLALIYGSLLLSPATHEGLLAAQKYHAARGGFDLVFVVGSLSRLVRWYLPVFILLGLGVAAGAVSRRGSVDANFCSRQRRDGSLLFGRDRKIAPTGLILLSFLAVFVVQMLAPFPYEDYQVPIMPLLAIFATVKLVDAVFSSRPVDAVFSSRPVDAVSHRVRNGENDPLLTRRDSASTVLLTLGLTWASSFGSPLLEKWTMNGQDRFWSLKKEKTELAQLREVARRINELDPGGNDILTQDTYLAIETNRKVPAGLEMGPFSVLTDEAWRKLLSSAPCRVAAFSGYGFAVNPPVCDERPMKDQLDYWTILKDKYDLAFSEEAFGQNATTLLVLERK